MKRYRITLDDRTFDVHVLDDPRQGRVRVQVDGETLTVDVETLAAGPEERQAGSPDAIGPPVAREAGRPAAPPDDLATAPLPGVIKSIAVRPGQEVASGDPLLVIEAMKMDNVIRAARPGTVGTVHVAEGHHVAHGDALVTFSD